MEYLLLVLLGLAPPIGFLLYILHLDRIEPEPLGLIAKLLALGGLAVLPVGVIELVLFKLPLFSAGGLAGSAVKSFLLIAPLEEAAKLAVVMIFAWKNRNFNEENDGIVYAGTVAIGFAMVENVLYVVQFGLATGIMRAMTAIPLHTFTGVLMGYFIGIARFASAAPERNVKVARGFFMAYGFHAVYDTFVLSETVAALFMVPLVVALFVMGIVYLKKGKKSSFLRWNSSFHEAGAVPVTLLQPAAPSSVGPVAIDEEVPPPGAPLHGSYKAVVARILFALCGGFWALLVIGIIQQTGQAINIVIGGIIISAVPLVVGIVLELSYQRDKAGPAAG